MNPLTRNDKIHLDAALGWLGLDDYLSANQELELITPLFRAHPDVLTVRYRIFEKAEKWSSAADVAYSLSKLVPQDSFGIRHYAFALHKLKRTQDAWDALFPFVDAFSTEWQILYDLARYAAQTNKLTESFILLEKAIDVSDSAQVKVMALEDREFELLWANLSEV